MDEETRARYESWKRKKIRNLMIKLGIILLAIFSGLHLATRSTEPVVIEEYSNGNNIKDFTKVDERVPANDESSAFFAELSSLLQEASDSVGGRAGISFLCLTTSTEISINGDELFFGASTAKLPRLMRIAEMVEEGYFTWDHEIEYHSENIQFHWGTGILQGNIQNGDTRTISELTRLAAVYSDNIAYWMLSHYTVALENRIQDVFDHYLSGEKTEGKFSANHMVRILNILYNGLDEIEAYSVIYQHYLDSSFRERLYTPQTSGYVAHVIGSNESYIHDVGIFSGDNPYILAVMTYGVYHAGSYISDISDMVWEKMREF